ncbi:dethiobiotin synthase [Marmoricola sp. RAF53]|uniref:dethiobiotin synthase n=1 Tax=Marmoricola sp. RAF53 TaxID=3233059 RepID=UPI003F9C30E4
MTVTFVTGTDTEVGKTVATAALVVALRAAGEQPYVIKPAQTGMAEEDYGDLDAVRHLAGPVPGHEGVRLQAPLAPDTAARLEGVTLPDLATQRDAIVDAEAEHHVLVEGAGGVLVPLGHHWNVIDLAETVAHAGVPVRFVVVARAGLGTLNHSALTVQAIAHRGLEVGGVVIGSWPATPDLAAEQNLLDLPVLTGVPVLGRIPQRSGLMSVEEFTAAAAGWLTLPAD